MSRFGILSTLTRPLRTWCRHTAVRLQRLKYDSSIRKRIARKLGSGDPIHAIFVVHEPRSYSAISSMIDEMNADCRFIVTILAVHYKHGVFSDNNYHDGGAVDYLRDHGIPFQTGSDLNGNFIDLKTLNPDIVVFQTPYNQYLFPSSYEAKEVSKYAFVAYTPYYGISMSDDIKSITHLPYFFQYVRYALMGSEFDCDDIKNRVYWCKEFIRCLNCGCPKFSYALSSKYDKGESAWKFSGDTAYRILWTPRWNPDEGTSHFTAYWDVLLKWARKNSDMVEFVFRPHPLMFNYLIKTGRLTAESLGRIRDEFSKSSNASIDENDGYHDTFLGADCLIADPTTSMSLEFVVQDKPVVYTEKEGNQESGFVKTILPGFYVVNSEHEMIATLDMLVAGKEDMSIKASRRKVTDGLLAPLKEKSCGKRAIDAIISDVLSK